MHYPMDRQCPFAPPEEVVKVQAEGAVPRVTIWNGIRPWLFTRFDDVRVVLSDPRFSADKSRPNYPLSSAAALAEVAVPPTLLVMDDPDHSYYRRLVLSEFTVKRSEAARPAVRRVAEGCVDRMLEGPRPGDLVEAVALPIAFSTVCELIAVPFQDRGHFHALTYTMNSMRVTTDEAAAARQEMHDYLVGLVRAREAKPENDFISRMAVQHVRTGAMTHDVLGAMAVLLLTAGHDTTANMIALGVLALLEHPDQLAALRASDDPAALTRAADELLRYLTIVQRGIRRIAVEDVDVGGHHVKAGDGVVAAINVANLDPERFATGGNLDLTNDSRDNLAFGFGPHQCLGQALARVELEEAYRAVVRGIPTLRVAVPFDEIRFKTDMAVYGVHELPVEW
jgi:hypothetical protein